MKSFICLLLLSFFFMYADDPWCTNIRVSTDVPWDTLNQGESCFAVWRDSIFSVCNTAERGTVPIAPYSYSFNSGQTFTQIPFTDLTSGIIWHTDPVIGVDDSGHVHMLIQYSATLMKHYLSRDGGQTWVDTTQVNPFNGVDKPWMIVNANEIYIAWQQTVGTTGIWFAKSTDYGQTFSANQIWNRRYINALGMDENENLHLLLVSGTGGVYYRKSTDKGDNWLPEIYLANWSYSSSYGDRAPINSITARGNVVFGTWVNDAPGGWDVLAVRSTDGGDTWSVPFTVNDITVGGQCKGWAHFDVYGGLHLIYYHSPDWPTSVSSVFELRYQYSSDSGATFNPSIRVSDTSFTSLADFMGEYHICVSDSQYLYAIWTDGRNGDDNDLYFSKALLSELRIDESTFLSAHGQNTLLMPTIWYGTIDLHIPQNPHPIDIDAYDVTGRLITNIWSGEPTNGQSLRLRSADFPRGVIFVRAASRTMNEVIKVVNLGAD
ncbi:MAG: exo-alpha-sialidase [candidate division WOR-3 bacterium]|nr:MAG: exo-alpha-sialidase [candidate division WOR-3 bacterium]